MNAGRLSQVSRATACYDLALQNTLPTHPQDLLLAACLREPPVASAAWRDFVAVVGDPKQFFERNGTGLKGLLPFVESRLAANAINAGRSFHTYARVASVREALRSRIYLEILGGVLSAFDRNGVSSVLLKGGAVSATVYPQPSTRHNHAIDLWVSVWRCRALAACSRQSSSFLNCRARVRQAIGVSVIAAGLHWRCIRSRSICRTLICPSRKSSGESRSSDWAKSPRVCCLPNTVWSTCWVIPSIRGRDRLCAGPVTRITSCKAVPDGMGRGGRDGDPRRTDAAGSRVASLAERDSRRTHTGTGTR